MKDTLTLADVRTPGSRPWFEYHCYEGHDSADAAIWYRSHQQATIISVDETCDAFVCGIVTRKERDESACSLMYCVRFDDGHEATVFEDELLDSPAEYYRPDPPRIAA